MASQNTSIALTIAGSDPSGGAGIQADLKTFTALGVYGCAAITALTAQNTHGVSGVWPLPEGSVAGQIASVLEDVPVGAVKLGMLLNSTVIAEVTRELSKRPDLPLVCDPVMVATSGDRLLDDSAVASLTGGLLPLSHLITPNTAEAAVLLDCAPADSEQAMERQAEALLEMGPRAVLLKGGHLPGDQASDLLLWAADGALRSRWFRAPRIDTRNTHGTGCTLAAAIAAGLAQGRDMEAAVGAAKQYLSGAIAHADRIRVGSGAGPVDHLWRIET
ncbi:bifunctional hydroxymethylpyrimidine kinase/phosphomethylpyrimidine kinase [Gilvimarinus sp. F26214L]|uniref:bifunctional hydroxymethylpyrimidine kinase/phosphomethylpyrimidine kinase n=1 Tax=Gilvimarinus sp. DZF01 TaxID=3461371 RepID=UPI004045DB1B